MGQREQQGKGMGIKVLASPEDPWCHRVSGPGGGFGAGLELLVQGGQGLSQALESPVPSHPPESKGHHPHVTSGRDGGTRDTSDFLGLWGPPGASSRRSSGPAWKPNQIQAINEPQRAWEPQRVWDRL